jgi:hypothetical protein
MFIKVGWQKPVNIFSRLMSMVYTINRDILKSMNFIIKWLENILDTGVMHF